MLAISARMRPTSGKATLHTDELPASAVTDAAMLQAVHASRRVVLPVPGCSLRPGG